MRAGKVGGGERQKDQYYRNIFDGIYKIARDEGPRALLNGSLARIYFLVPNVAIAMSLVEVLKPKVQNFL